MIWRVPRFQKVPCVSHGCLIQDFSFIQSEFVPFLFFLDEYEMKWIMPPCSQFVFMHPSGYYSIGLTTVAFDAVSQFTVTLLISIPASSIVLHCLRTVLIVWGYGNIAAILDNSVIFVLPFFVQSHCPSLTWLLLWETFLYPFPWNKLKG